MAKTCKTCKIEKNESEFRLNSGLSSRRNFCRFCERQKQASYLLSQKGIDYRNSESFKISVEKYKKGRRNEWRREKLQKDPIFRLENVVRSRIYAALKGRTKGSSTVEFLGCSFPELKQHLESNFQNGMSWENYGKWEIDHIIPISLAKNEEDFKKLSHFTNLQPLWAIENRLKSNKVA